MPDRDPALEAALKKYFSYPMGWETWQAAGEPRDQMRFIAEGMWDAAFRSLGASTPEAQAALRELVTAIRTPVATMSDIRLRDKAVRERLDVFSCIATPPEEGR